jgi:LacI family repressor for deo operon, udp, cdd, tsx, nupC, and nupG
MQPRRVGLVLTRPARVLGEEPYYHEFIEGLERMLTPMGVSVLLKVVTDRAAETATYQRWAADRQVSGVLLVDLAPGDERAELVERLELAAAVIGDPSTAPGLPAVRTDDAGGAREATRFLAERGHRTIGHVSGPMGFAQTQLRRDGFEAEAAVRGMTVLKAEGDYSYESGKAAAETLLRTAATAIVFDNDVMAIAGLEAAREAGRTVPADVSVIAWDDSAQCQLAVPALSALSHDAERIGELAAAAILDAMTGPEAVVYEAPHAHIVVRESTN